MNDDLRPVTDWIAARTDQMVALLVDLARLESPTDRPETQAAIQERLRREFEASGYRMRLVAGRSTGGHLLAVPRARTRGRPFQLLIGHCDTVWPVGTLETMPVEARDGRLYGPGTFDMKAGLVQGLFAVRALRALSLRPAAEPVFFVNSDEEIGSPESVRWIGRLAQGASRALILEPAYGPEGALKTSRKGVSRYELVFRGRASHAGLAPEAGRSAIRALAHTILRLDELGDAEAGLTLNVGVVEGGTRPNVVPELARAQLDVRALHLADLDRFDEVIRTLAAGAPGVTLQIQGGVVTPPLEVTPRNRALWQAALEVADGLGLSLTEVCVGGGSDGNHTGLHTATLDGLGAVGDGAHAEHEHVVIQAMAQRAALVAGLLLHPLADPVS